MERVELSCHTKASRMDGLVEPQDLIRCAWESGHRAVAITDFQNVRSFMDAAYAVEGLRDHCQGETIPSDFKVLYGMETELDDGSLVRLIVQTQTGLNQLYRLVEIAYQNWEHPFLRKSDIQEHRDGLFVCCPGEDGEVYRGILAGLNQGQLEEITGFYDCLEVMPPECYRLLSTQERFPNNDVFEMEDIIRKTVMLGKRANKLVAAVGNIRVMEENELDAYKILKDDDDVPPLFFRSTEDMLGAFSFLDTQTAHQIVVETPNHIADCCEEIEVLSHEPLYPIIPKAFQTVEALCQEQLQALFGDQVPKTAKVRLEHELSLLRDQELTCSSLLITRYLAQGLREKGRLVSSRGCIAASYVAYLLTIVDIDPQALNIPCETFVGLDGDRGPDIVLNISGSYQDAVIETLSGMIPRTALAYSGIDFGNQVQVTEETAKTMTSEYTAKYGMHWDWDEQERLQDCLYGVRLHDSVAFDRHLVIASDGDALRRLTPVCHLGGLNIIRHDYHSLENTLFRFELLSTPALNLLQKMEGMTGVSEMNIDIAEAVPLLLQDTTNIPEFDTPEARSIMSLAQPKTLDDLVKVNAMTRSTGAWDENAEMLLRDGVAPFCEVIGTRDDVFNRLLDAGLSREIAFRTSERVRMGKGLNDEQISVLAQAGIPEWYIESCNKILYLFPKAHCAACTALSLKAAWYKTHYPKEYTQAYSELFPT